MTTMAVMGQAILSFAPLEGKFTLSNEDDFTLA
jgi:hypothetical protein